MANRKENRYGVPIHTGHHDISAWLVGKPFFLSSAIKYMWRGWNDIEDLAKARHSLQLARLGETGTRFELMAADLAVMMKTATPSQKEHLKFMASISNPRPGVDYEHSQPISYHLIGLAIENINTRISALDEFGEAVHGDVYNG